MTNWIRGGRGSAHPGLEAAEPSIFEYLLSTGQMALECAPPQLWRDRPKEAALQCLNGIIHPDAPQAAIASIGTQFVLCGRWAISGFPSLSLTHRLAATLMATDVNEEILGMIRAPFPGVCVRIPNDMLFIEEGGQYDSATTLLFSEHAGNWTYCLLSGPTKPSLWAHDLPQEDLVSEGLPHIWDTLSRDDIDNRSEALARRLIAGFCLWVSDPRNVGQGRKMRPKQRGVSQRRRAGDELPSFTAWQLGHEVKLDARVIPAVRDYVLHGGRSPTVQSIVSGHWKMQVHGPGRSMRKLIHVAPYWRGPLDAPVLSKRGRDDDA